MLPTRSSLLLRHSRQSFHLDSETGQRTEDTGQNTGAGGGGHSTDVATVQVSVRIEAHGSRPLLEQGRLPPPGILRLA